MREPNATVNGPMIEKEAPKKGRKLDGQGYDGSNGWIAEFPTVEEDGKLNLLI